MAKKKTTKTKKKTTKKTKKPSSARKASPRRDPPAKKPSETGRVHLYVGISLDGCIAGPDGELDWLTPYADARSGFMPFIKTISAGIMGRTTYDHAVKNYGAGKGGGSGFGGMTSYVITHRPLETKSKEVIPFAGDLRELVALMREKHPGGDFWLMGGGGVTRSFIDADLIDIYSVAFVPTLIGAGLPMFPHGAFAEKRLTLVRQHTYPSGVIELRYERR